MRTSNPIKPRKPYKITKPRERWSQQEHEKFLEAIDRFGRDWKQIVAHIGSRSVSQVRSHAQKHFIRLEKKGMGDNVPPARRKARWAEKLPNGAYDNDAESDQEFSLLNQQTSSSSASTLEHQSMRPPLSSSQVLEGLGSTAEYSECQPITSSAQSLGSLASRNSSFTSPSSQTDFITFAQQMLLPGNQQEPAGPLPAPDSVSAINALQLQLQLHPEKRKYVMDLLQQVASQQQQATSPPFAAESLRDNDKTLQQHRVRQLLLQQQTAERQPVTRQQSSPPPFSPSAHSWHTNTGSAVPFTSSHRLCNNSYPSLPSSSAPYVNEYTSGLAPHSCVTPRLDGAALAECFSSPRPSSVYHGCDLEHSSPAGFARISCGQEPKHFSIPRQPSPNASLASNGHRHMLSSSPPLSCNSAVSVMKAEPLLEGYSPAPDALADLGLEDMEFWGEVVGEDPLMEAMEAAMGGTDESESSYFTASAF